MSDRSLIAHGDARIAVASVGLFLAAGCARPPSPVHDLAPGHRFRHTAAPVISSPVAYDVDADGRKEIAVGSWDGSFYLLDTDLGLKPGWPCYSPKGFFSSASVLRLKSGAVLLFASAESGKLFAWDAQGKTVAGYPVELGYRSWATPTILDDGRIAIGTRGQFRVYGQDGHIVAPWPQSMRGWSDATAASARGILTVTTLTPGDPSRGRLYAWNQRGEALPGFPVELHADSDSSPALAELDCDGRLYIVFGDDSGRLHAIATNAVERAGFPVRTLGPHSDLPPLQHAPKGGNPYSIEASPAIGDIDADGFPDIVVGAWDGRVYAWDRHGKPLAGWPVTVGDQVISSAALVDLDGDNRLDVVVGSKDGHLYGWTGTAASLPGFPRDLGAPVFSSPWVGDLDNDARADIVIGANNGIHRLRDVGPLGPSSWPMFHGNASRTGYRRRKDESR